PPVLAAIGPQSILEGANLTIGVSATDVDGVTPTLSATPLPAGASFTDNGDGTGSFTWTPDFTQSGTFNVTFSASDGLASDNEVVTISVTEAGNQPPVLAAIGAQVTTEGIVLAFGVSASDPDGTVPAITASPIPSGAVFIDNGNGTASFSWTPDFTQAGTFNITFSASDGILTDGETVTITVIEAGNQTPTLAAIGAQVVNEGINLAFPISSNDPDGTFPVVTAAPLPAGAAFIDNGDGSGSFDWTPGFTQSGLYLITFVASDGALADSEVVSITVNEVGNQSPVLAAIGPQSTTEGQTLAFGVSATDPDGTISILSAVNLPSGAVFTDNANGTGSFNWSPDFTQSGTFSVTFIAADGLLADSELVSIIIFEAGNQIPVLAAIGSRSVSEGANLIIAISAADADGTVPFLSAAPLPTGALFTDNGDGTGTFDWTPDFTQGGTYSVTFVASDGVAADSEAILISVTEAGNQAPLLAAIGPQSVSEGALLNFGVSASDPDGTTPVLSAVSLPVGASFVNNGDGTGSFAWTPDFTQAGTFNVTIKAADGVLTDSEIVTITVLEAGNQSPALAAIGSQSVTEGANLNFGVLATDPDGTTPNLTTSALPLGAVFTDNFDGTGTFDWTPDFTQSGGFTITFLASDGLATDSEDVTITIIEAGNQTPVLAAIGAQNITEGALLNIAVSATDPDGSTPGLSAAPLPSGAIFTDNGDGTGSFDWTPGFTQSGVFNVTFVTTDGLVSDSEEVTITVIDAGNQTPVLALIGPQGTNEGVLLSFGVSATDADGTTPILSALNVPLGAVFTDNNNGTGSFDWTPDFTQSGTFLVTFIATDGTAADSEIVSITVNELGNQAPVLADIGARSVTEGANLNFSVSATDVDATIPSLSVVALPLGATFVDNLNGTGAFDWSPDFTQSGVFIVTFIASDGILSDSEIVTITALEAGNQLPVLAAIGVQATTEGVNLTFGVSAFDVDGAALTLSASPLPTGAIFTDNGDGTGSFDWTPDFTQGGSYIINFKATDDSLAVDSELVTISVAEAGNQTPVLAAIGAQTVTEGINLTFGASASDPDGATPALNAVSLPPGATFIDNADGSGTFNWTPGFTQSGGYFVTIIATDGVAADSEIVSITVNEAGNQPPVLAVIGPQSVTEGQNLTVNASASDPDGTFAALSVVSLPVGAAFTDNGDGTGALVWTPDFTQAGVFSVIFFASDGLAIDSEIVSLTVAEAGNQAPVLATIGSRSVLEGVN
ncbi:MAG: hypothetical protein IH914_08065, partial [candidate division Zixibacteria bacterium]|nr:hypothetical protein [candidate division Zixibacteria bacterium]